MRGHHFGDDPFFYCLDYNRINSESKTVSFLELLTSPGHVLKKNYTIYILLTLFALNISLAAKSLAVIDLSTIFEKDQRVSVNASNYIRHLIHEDTLFNVLDKKTTYRILKDQNFQYSGNCSDISCDVKKGCLLEVNYLITGAINSIDNNYFMVLKLIDLSSEKLIGMVSKDIPKSTIPQMKSVVKELVDALLYDREEISGPIDNTTSVKNLNSIKLKSKPDSAVVVINGIKAGITPYLNNKILDGNYSVELLKKNYTPVKESFELIKGSTFNHSYSLDFSKEYKDSVRHEFFTKKGGRNTRRIAFGVVAALSAGTGLLFEYLASSESIKAEEYVNDYNIATSDFELHKENYQKAEKAFDKNVKYRNICYGISGGMLLGFFISLPF